MKIHQVRWYTLNTLEIRFQYVTNTLQYIGIRCHMTKRSQNFVLFYTFDINMLVMHTLTYVICTL